MFDNRTLHQDYPLPDADNFLQDDVVRIAEAITAIDNDFHQNSIDLQEKLEQEERINAERFRRIKINHLLDEQLFNV
ncbi:hypothetical protein SG34_025605 [Thalassomonas viridans]|uniref:Uncharacterized protein n=1 Tax=Thalassomonas viridans TaxID=137584 RepID=A0AAF0C8R7_9GAMM|nr:hypothetical protein [Thalassomonas viridans]WDE04666.1 hypothetical protein SG34_025605 [Thalassomonas viridans]